MLVSGPWRRTVRPEATPRRSDRECTARPQPTRPIASAIMAAEPTTALRIDKRVFLELLAQFPQMSLAIMRELAKRLEHPYAMPAAK